MTGIIELMGIAFVGGLLYVWSRDRRKEKFIDSIRESKDMKYKNYESAQSSYRPKPKSSYTDSYTDIAVGSVIGSVITSGTSSVRAEDNSDRNSYDSSYSSSSDSSSSSSGGSSDGGGSSGSY